MILKDIVACAWGSMLFFISLATLWIVFDLLNAVNDIGESLSTFEVIYEYSDDLIIKDME